MTNIHKFTEHIEPSVTAASGDLGITATMDPQRAAALQEEMNEAIGRAAAKGWPMLGAATDARSLEEAA